jgi:pre-mRNA-splicing factor RBM22/SLT11
MFAKLVCWILSLVTNVQCNIDAYNSTGLPVQVRDSVADTWSYIPQSDINREWYLEQTERAIASGQLQIGYGRGQMDMRQQNQLAKVARPAPYYPRNKAHVCSFFQKGTCTRGDNCPYRHEKVEETELSHQNIKDRYYGVNDPVAKKLLGRVGAGTLNPPEDTEIKTLWVGGVIDKLILEEDLRYQVNSNDH